MPSNLKRIVKATIINVIVALIFGGIIVLAGDLVAGNKIATIVTLVNKMAVKTPELKQVELIFNKEAKKLDTYPLYGTKYGEIKIDSINLVAPVYLGDNNKILKLGVGHYSGSYFPGEGGSILYAAHNNSYFKKLPYVVVGDLITITTDYGTFNYKVYATDIIKETEEDKLPIDDKEEILMLYTCYPLTGIGHKSHRFVVYARLEED